MDSEPKIFAIVELMGHRVLAGAIAEHQFAGKVFLRIDVPPVRGRPGFSRLQSPDAIYGISACDEATMLAFAERNHMEPIVPVAAAGRPALPPSEGSDPNDQDDQFEPDLDPDTEWPGSDRDWPGSDDESPF